MNQMLSVRHIVNYLIAPRLSGHVRRLETSSTVFNSESRSHHEGTTPSEKTVDHEEQMHSEKAAGSEGSSQDLGSDYASAQEQENPFPDGSDGEDQLRREILDAALPYVHSFGWSQDALAQGAESLGYSGMAHGLFTKGGVELVNHFYATCNGRLKEFLEKEVDLVKEQPELKKGTTAFIATAVEERLRMNIEYIDIWHKALALHASPLNAQQALENITNLVDHIWYHAGDRSTDFNWYTKRGLLAAIYKSTEIYMLQDRSEDFQDSWAFMNRRLSDVHSVGKCARSAENFAGNFVNYSKAGLITVQ
ncbi:ubiquinone biosynthesis protein COQ9-B, mitochondrial-like isoform X3 [Palaemon carinicauda]|uniref:ubiquinone biosynthesis protein COQ9-B, mitochondrial-like isoform X3 n=1 Tax=Palaemon carinicauda TaxID=392227 RepID=UPI0035B59BB9